MAMGLSDAVPGISGGTMALLLGIHPRLVRALAHLRWDVVRRGAWREMDLGFLVLLGLGVVSGLVLGAKVLVLALDSAPRFLSAFLLGLVVAGVRAPARRVTWTGSAWLWALLTGLFALAVTAVHPVAAPSAMWFLPLAGAIAAVAMILPGISGAYLLLLMGLYEPVIHAVAALDLVVVVLVGGGAFVGLLSFSHALHWLLENRSSLTHAAMVGLLVGSLGRLWPWRTEAGFAAGQPASPSGNVLLVLFVVLLGAALVWALEMAVRRGQSPATSPIETEKGT